MHEVKVGSDAAFDPFLVPSAALLGVYPALRQQLVTAASAIPIVPANPR